MARKPASPVSALDAHLGYWLRFVSNQVSHAFALKVSAHGVTVAEWVVLRELLGAPGMMQTVLAERMGMTRGAISKLADRLAAKGLIERRADTKDARAYMLHLTGAGEKLVPVLAGLADRNDAEFFAPLSSGERRALKSIMQAIVAHKNLKTVPVD